jgi:WhiB family redox-sensing transcriptional regulator
MGHRRRNRHCPAQACGRFDADAAALQHLAAESKDSPARAHYLRLDRRPTGRRQALRDRSRADASAADTARHVARDLPCQVHDPDLWFADAPADLELAKALCADCPALQACLAGALDRREPFGVWGGQIFQYGRVVTFKRPRGRPRKDSTAPEQLPALPDTA